MRTVFADTCYWVALLNPKDDLHQHAQRVSRQLGACRVVTSEFVLLEMMNLLASRSRCLKRVAVDAIKSMRADPNMEIVPASSSLFQKAYKVYAEHKDKKWSAVDCSSFVTMQEKRITEALTEDKHFEQMGFRALLREQKE